MPAQKPQYEVFPGDATLCPPLVSAVTLMTYVTEEENWPRFLEWIKEQEQTSGIPIRAVGVGDEELRQIIRGHNIAHIIMAHGFHTPENLETFLQTFE